MRIRAASRSVPSTFVLCWGDTPDVCHAGSEVTQRLSEVAFLRNASTESDPASTEIDPASTESDPASTENDSTSTVIEPAAFRGIDLFNSGPKRDKYYFSKCPPTYLLINNYT